MSTAPKEEVMQYLDQMDEGSVIRVLMYVKSLSDQKKNKKSPYGKFKTAEEYAKAKDAAYANRQAGSNILAVE